MSETINNKTPPQVHHLPFLAPQIQTEKQKEEAYKALPAGKTIDVISVNSPQVLAALEAECKRLEVSKLTYEQWNAAINEFTKS